MTVLTRLQVTLTIGENNMSLSKNIEHMNKAELHNYANYLAAKIANGETFYQKRLDYVLQLIANY